MEGYASCLRLPLTRRWPQWVAGYMHFSVKACHGLCECGHTVLFFSKRRKGLNQRLTAFPTYLDLPGASLGSFFI